MKWIKACDTHALAVDGVTRVESAAGPIAVYHLRDGWFATQDTCTHAVASLADGFVEDGMIECPVHAGKVCIKTGEPRTLPATEPLATFVVKIEGEDVLLAIPDDEEESAA